MKIQPTLEECMQLAEEGGYGVIPVSTEIFSDTSTPIGALRILKKVSAHVYLLESAEADIRQIICGIKKIMIMSKWKAV